MNQLCCPFAVDFNCVSRSDAAVIWILRSLAGNYIVVEARFGKLLLQVFIARLIAAIRSSTSESIVFQVSNHAVIASAVIAVVSLRLISTLLFFANALRICSM